MCMCPSHPNINGQPGYSWDGKSVGTRPVDPPDLGEGDALIFDEPGRCGGCDAHSHHFRLVSERGIHHTLLVRHGGGDERIRLGVGSASLIGTLGAVDTHARYWMLHLLYSTHRDGQVTASTTVTAQWRTAAAEKRIKTRKVRNGVKVWIEGAPNARIAEAWPTKVFAA